MARLLTVLFVSAAIAPALLFAGDDASEGPTGPDQLRFAGYPDAPAFEVAPRERRIRRCARCHARMDPNPTIRELTDAPHVDGISHGKGRVWCLVCHDEKDRGYLRTLLGEKVDIYKAYLICGSCHAARQKDWYYGGHGKRVANWQGARVLYNCTHCHDPHQPVIEPRKPKSPPKTRLGLKNNSKPVHVLAEIWERRDGAPGTAHE